MSNSDFITQELRRAVIDKPPLHPVFDGIFLDKRPLRFSRNIEYNPVILTGKNIFDISEAISTEKLEEELSRLEALHPDARRETLFYLAQKYGWRIGSPGNTDLQDTAFCDTLRVQSALECMGNEQSFLLLKGDLSGIQEYIYGDLQPKTAGGLTNLSKRLRGRSTVIALLTDFLAGIILKEMELPTWCLLFAGGGHFNLLIPKSREKELEELSANFDQELRNWFGDRLSLILAWVECDDSILSHAGSFFQRVNTAKETKKYRQHADFLSEHFFPETAPASKRYEINDVEIGEKFPKRNLLLETVSSIGISSKFNASQVFHFQTYRNNYQLFIIAGDNEQESLSNARKLIDEAGRSVLSAQLLTINDADFIPAKADWDYSKYPHIGFGFRFLGKNVPFTEKDKRPKTFEEIAFSDEDPEKPLTEEQRKRGFLRLGAMRLDVDDLGCIFSHGLGANATLSQIVCLSREIHYFFTAHLDHLASQYDIYVIYSGGDDAFVVGRWDNVIAFARKLRNDFQKLVHKNKSIHFSAGIFLGDPRYPVGRFYRDTGRLQDKAKGSFHKNQVNVFDNTMSWDEFDGKVGLGIDFARILTDPSAKSQHKLTLAFANRVLRLVKSSFHENSGLDENGQKVRRGFMDVPRFTRNVVSLRYLFARHGYTQDKLADITDELLKKLTIDFIRSFDKDAIGKTSKAQKIRNYLVAFNYTLYTIRSQKKSENRHDG